ncbi:MAG: hypothetical protein H0T93_13020, partial [Chloroflexia bacterium]|nr:hypothetical protein [Chloroflexia bacterium]
METRENPRRARRLAVAIISLLLVVGSIVPGAHAVAQDACEWPSETLQLMAPAAAGGGWDTTARELQRVLDEEGIVEGDVEVYNVEGAGGTIGLAELVSEHAG